MASIIKIKRSAVTAVPTTLNEGELAYSELSDQLFIGTNGGVDIDVIGGKKFTDYLNHTPGTLTASAAILVDASSKIDNIKVDNIDIDGNTISTTDTNGDLILAPDGTGAVDIKKLIINGGAVEITGINNDSTLATASANTLSTDLAIKTYIDSIASGLNVKNPVRAATTPAIGDIDLGVAADPTPLDGVTLVDGDRVLLKNQSDQTENGIYVAVTATDPTTWVRAVDFDENSEAIAGAFTFVEEGTVNADTGWVVSTDNAITLGSTNIVWIQFSSAGIITAGDGIDKVGNVVSVDVTDIIGAGLDEDGGNNLIIAIDGVNETHIELSNNAALVGRNVGDSADVDLIKVNVSDEVELPNGATLGADLDGQTTTGNDGFTLINCKDPVNAQDVATKAYVDQEVANINELGELADVTLTSPAAGDLLIFTGTGDNSVNQTMSGDITINAAGVTTISAGAVDNSMLANDSFTISDGSNTSPIALGGTLTITDAGPINVTEAAGTVTVGLGTVPIANGGTNLTTVGADGKVMQSNGSIIVYDDLDGGTF